MRISFFAIAHAACNSVQICPHGSTRSIKCLYPLCPDIQPGQADEYILKAGAERVDTDDADIMVSRILHDPINNKGRILSNQPELVPLFSDLAHTGYLLKVPGPDKRCLVKCDLD